MGSEPGSEGVRQRGPGSASIRSSSPASSTCTSSRGIDRQGEGKARKLRRYVLQKHDHVERAVPTGLQHDDVGRLVLHVHGAFGLPNICRFGSIQPYAIVTVGDSTIRTSTINGEVNPTWDEKMVFPVTMPADGSPIDVAVEVWHDSYTKNELISSTSFEVFQSFPGNGPCEERFRVVSLLRPKCEDGGMVRYSLTLTSVERLQDRARRLDKMNKIPLLPETVMYMNLFHDKIWAFKAVSMENWRSLSVFSTIYTVAATPVRVVRGFARSVVRRLASLLI